MRLYVRPLIFLLRRLKSKSPDRHGKRSYSKIPVAYNAGSRSMYNFENHSGTGYGLYAAIKIQLMETIISVKHRSVQVTASFEEFTEKLQTLLGKIGEEDFEYIKSRPDIAKEHLATLGGFENMILFGIQEHGPLLRLAGQQRKALQYILGNPLIALQMTQYDIRAALYAPLRVLVYEGLDGKVVVEYDLPSSLFGQFGHPDVLETGLLLDGKVEKLILAACSLNDL